MKKLIAISFVALLLVGCSSQRQVTRMDADTTTDLSGGWNDTDSRLVAQEMVSDCLSRPWIDNFLAANGKPPVVTVGKIRNKSSEHIDTETFTTDFERELINSNRIKFVARPEERVDVREERLDQDYYASPETRKQLRQETGADYILLGSVKSITDQVEGKSTIFYQTDLELINIETNEKVWIGTKKIKKGISQGKADF